MSLPLRATSTKVPEDVPSSTEVCLERIMDAVQLWFWDIPTCLGLEPRNPTYPRGRAGPAAGPDPAPRLRPKDRNDGTTRAPASVGGTEKLRDSCRLLPNLLAPAS